MEKIHKTRERVIIDTDIGDDIDDALAIALALNSPELEIAGITTVFRNTKARARIVQNLLRTAGRTDIPVAAGIGTQLINAPVDTLFQKINVDELPGQYSEDMDKEKITYTGDAIDFFEETLNGSEEPITIIPIGPLTNIAAFLIKNPAIKSRIKRIVLMGGAYFTNTIEYNIMCDPEAARIVFDSCVEITGVGLDVTGKCQLTEADVDAIRKRGTPVTNLLHALISRHRSYAGHTPYLHDPLAVAVAFDESFVEMERKRIGIETKGELTRGMTFNISNSRWWENNIDSPSVRVCKEVDRDRFVRLFMERILQ